MNVNLRLIKDVDFVVVVVVDDVVVVVALLVATGTLYLVVVNFNLRLLKATIKFLWWSFQRLYGGVVNVFYAGAHPFFAWVIFVSNQTTVLMLCCVVVGVVTIIIIIIEVLYSMSDSKNITSFPLKHSVRYLEHFTSTNE